MKKISLLFFLVFFIAIILFLRSKQFDFDPTITGRVTSGLEDTGIKQEDAKSIDILPEDDTNFVINPEEDIKDDTQSGSQIDAQSIPDEPSGRTLRTARRRGSSSFIPQPKKDPLQLIIISPKANSMVSGGLTFTYEAKSATNCSLLIDGEVIYSDRNITDPDSFVAELPLGIHRWQIGCFIINSTYFTKPRKVYVLNSSLADSADDFENIPEFRIRNNFGNIRFLRSINLSRAENFQRYVKVMHNYIEIDSDEIPELNKPAVLTLQDVNLDFPAIFRDGEYCADCNILSSGKDITFSVEHFSSYTAGGNARLFTYDTTDSQTKYPSQTITFFANYSAVAGGPINPGTCNINFTDTGTSPMTYNPTSQFYEYNRTFSQAGVYYFDIGCSGAGYTLLATTDYSSINLVLHPYGANVTSFGSERGIGTSQANQSTYSGNVTKLSMDSLTITSYWQGFYGNVSGKITLDNAQGYTLYDWDYVSITGEIFASRAFDVNFATLNCSNETHIANEETYLGHTAQAGDSVRNTFNSATHPALTIGVISITANSCNATNLYVNGLASTDFYEVLLSDDAKNMVYTSIIDENLIGFDGNTYDFQMLVGDRGNSSITTYYFFMELG